MFISDLHCQLVLRISSVLLHKNTCQYKIPIVPEEGWFGQRKYSTPSKNILRRGRKNFWNFGLKLNGLVRSNRKSFLKVRAFFFWLGGGTGTRLSTGAISMEPKIPVWGLKSSVKRIAIGRLVPIHSQNKPVSRSGFEMEDVGSLLFVFALDQWRP